MKDFHSWIGLFSHSKHCSVHQTWQTIVSQDRWMPTSRCEVQPDQHKCCALIEMSPHLNPKKGCTLFRINELCGQIFTNHIWNLQSIRKLTSVKTGWTLNSSNIEPYNKAKHLIKRDMCMKFYIKLNQYT